MIDATRHNIPEDDPIRALFHTLTERGFGQMNLHDDETIEYITNLLTDFVEVENMFRARDDQGRQLQNLFELLQQAGETISPSLRRDYYRHLGDLTLFRLGLYPESLTYGRRTVSPGFYMEQGRRSYHLVADLDSSRPAEVFHKLSDHFEQCVVGLNWVKRYINDPFYQYAFREFGIT